MSRALPLPEALEEIRRRLYPRAQSKRHFAQLLGADIKISPLTIKEWQQGNHHPQAAAMRQLNQLAKAAGIEIAGSPQSYPQVILPIGPAIDAISARIPVSIAEIAKRCKVNRSQPSQWRNHGILPREDDVRDRLRRLASEANVRIEGL